MKIYDKILDLAGSDGSDVVGCKIATIMSCKRQLTIKKRICRTQTKGMTMLEIGVMVDVF